MSAPVDWVPESALPPDHDPLAVQDVAFVLDQDRVEAPPEATLVGEALRLTVGADVPVALTVTLRVTAQKPFEHRRVKVLVVLRGLVVVEPAGSRHPDQAPDA